MRHGAPLDFVAFSWKKVWGSNPYGCTNNSNQINRLETVSTSRSADGRSVVAVSLPKGQR